MSSGPIPSPQIAATVPVTPSGNLASTDAQAALVELQGDVDTINAAQATTGALTLYVDPLGNDANAGMSPGASACLTIRGALSKVPKRIRHAVTVSIAAGTYEGFAVQGFTIELPEDSARAAYLDIVADMQLATLATGTSSGTATGGSGGSGTTYGTLIDSGQSWTSNDLVGKFVEITVSGLTRAFPISANDATSLTVVGTWSTPTGLAYSIKSHAVTVNTMLPAAEMPVAKFYATPPASSKLSYGIVSVHNNLAAPNTSSVGDTARIFLRNLLVDGSALPSPSGFTALSTVNVADNNQVGLYNCTIKSTTGASPNILASGSVTVSRGYVTCLSAKRGIQVSGVDGLSPSILVSNTLFTGGAWGLLFSVPMRLSNVTSSMFTGQTTAAIQQAALSQLTTMSGLVMVGGGGSTVGILINSTGGAVFGSSTSTGSISGFGTAVKVDGPNVCRLGTWTGTGNTTGISLSLGAAVQIGSGTTLTGTTEVSIDGVASDLATMRAASPKLIVNTYTTRFHE